MTDELISTLSRVRRLRLIGKTSVERYRETRKGAREIGRELDVKYILEGSIRRYRKKVRCSLNMIDASNDERIWGESYDREIADIFDTQVEIASHVSASLNAALDPGSVFLQKERIENTRAFSLYLKGRHAWNRRDEKGIRRNPHFAIAHTCLGECYLQAREYRRAIASYKKSFQISKDNYILPYLAFAYAMAGEADSALSIAEELKRNVKEPELSSFLAIIYSGMKDMDASFRLLERAKRGKVLQVEDLRYSVIYEGVRNDPRYVELMRDLVAKGLLVA